MRTHCNPKHRQSGSSLLEVLISLLVISIGMLGIAGITAAASSYNKLGQVRSTAMLLVSDYTDRARANITAFDTGAYANITAYAYSKTLATESGCTDASVAANSCDANTMAAFDQTQWLNLLRVRLPGGDAYITTSSTLGGGTRQRAMDVWVMWSETDQNTGFAVAGAYKCPAAATTDAAVKCLYFRVAV
jgi:type IV pilus assembly protein PilV